MSPEWGRGRPQHSYCLDPPPAQGKWIRLSSHLGLSRSVRWYLSALAPAALSWRAGVPGHAAISWNIMWWAELGQVGGSNCAGGWLLPSKEALGQGWDWEAGWDWGSRVGHLFLYMGLGR